MTEQADPVADDDPFPVVFITLAALLVLDNNNGSIRCIRDRIWICCLLWLTAALQQQALSVWAHLVFLGKLMVAAAISSRSGRRSSLHHQLFRHALQNISMAAWCALIVDVWVTAPMGNSDSSSTATHGDSPPRGQLSRLIFAIVLLASIAVRWTQDSRQRSKQHFRSLTANFGTVSSSLPVSHTATTSATTAGPDESHWIDWNPDDVVDWIMMKIQMQSHLTRSTNWDVLSPTNLLEERIAGQQLARLSVADWRSMGLSFGMSLEIYDWVQDLQQRFPPTTTTTTAAASSSMKNEHQQRGWLEELDAEYNQGPSLEHGAEAGLSFSTIGMVLEDSQEVKAIMRRRYGFELPALKGVDSQQEEVVENQTVDLNHLNHNNETVSPPVHTPVRLEGLPPSFLDNLPPHISEIVRRKPKLAQQILEQRRQDLQTQFHGTPNPRHHPPMMTRIYETAEEQLDDDSSDDKHTGLLKRPYEPKHKYKSIR